MIMKFFRILSLMYVFLHLFAFLSVPKLDLRHVQNIENRINKLKVIPPPPKVYNEIKLQKNRKTDLNVMYMHAI